MWFGLITTNTTNPLKTKIMSDIGEIYDIYCVSKSNKLLAGLDFSAYGKRKLRKLNVSKIKM